MPELLLSEAFVSGILVSVAFGVAGFVFAGLPAARLAFVDRASSGFIPALAPSCPAAAG